MKNQIYEITPCNICSSKISEIISKKGKFNETVINRICKNCSNIYVSPRLKKEFLKSYYETIYSKDYNKDIKDIGLLMIKRDEKAKKRLNFLKKNIKLSENLNVLEIGCSSGNFLNLLKQEGLNVIGIELSQIDIEIAKKYFDLEILNDFFENLNFSNKEFYLICLFHVIEHFQNPKEALKLIWNLLSPDGFVYIETPSVLRAPGLTYRSEFFRNVHLNTFSPLTFKALLVKTGFNLIAEDLEYVNIRAIAKKVISFENFLPNKIEIEKNIKMIKNHLRYWDFQVFLNKNILKIKKIFRGIF